MKRVAIVVQRYAEEITGGAERHARLVAELLAPLYEVTVLTSCAIDYVRWSMDLAPGEYRIGGVRVRRFAHPERNDLGRARVPRIHKLRFLSRRLLQALPGPRVARPNGDADHDGWTFLRRQGPHCPALYQHLKDSAAHYDAVIFFTALYEPTAAGLAAWGRRSLLVPLLHDEKAMYLPVFHEVFRNAGAILFNAAAERRLAERLYGVDMQSQPLAGIGVEMPEPKPDAAAAALARFELAPGYLIYVGRIDTAKGCGVLLEAFLGIAAGDENARLVLVGHSVMNLPQHPRIVHTGFVSEAERDALVANAAALVIPSRYESLSAVLLEAMLLGTPVVANAQCEVLADHLDAAGTGFGYRGQRQLKAALRQALAMTPAQRRAAVDLGVRYVRANYTWQRVREVFVEAIERVSRN